jgi:hypothetical protein
MISAGGRSPIVYQVGEELLLFIGWNGNWHSASICNVPQLAASVAHGMFEKLFSVQLAWTDVWFILSKNSNEARKQLVKYHLQTATYCTLSALTRSWNGRRNIWTHTLHRLMLLSYSAMRRRVKSNYPGLHRWMRCGPGVIWFW